MLPSLYEEKTGRFTGLTEQQVGTLNPDQLRAYNHLADVTAKLEAANTEAGEARDHHHTSVRKLQEAEAEAKKHQWTPHNEWKAMIAAGRGLPTDRQLLQGAVIRCRMQGKEITRENLLAELPPGFPLEIEDGTGATAPTLYDLQEAVSDSAIRLHEADARQRAYRAHVAAAITQWQNAIDTPASFESLVRQHIASENAERARRVEAGEVRVSGRPGRSVIDQFAYATRNSGRRAGGGSGFRRGGVSYTEAMRLNAERARQLAPVKPK